MISFARGAPAPECLDAALLAECARAAVVGDAGVLAYGAGGGYAPLREWLGGRHGVDAARVILTNGGLHPRHETAESAEHRNHGAQEDRTGMAYHAYPLVKQIKKVEG
jgi:hypothetical protein